MKYTRTKYQLKPVVGLKWQRYGNRKEPKIRMVKSRKFEFWWTKLLGNRFIISKSEEDLNKVLAKAGGEVQKVRHVKKTPYDETRQMMVYIRRSAYEKYKQRAYDLGFFSISLYVKFLMGLDYNNNLIKKSEDFLGESKYEYKARSSNPLS